MADQLHDVTFRPRARLVSILGEHLISDQAVGLTELVKNAYDADATRVVVELSSITSLPDTSIVITDNGSGMTLDDLVAKWLSPAVDHKERGKHNGERTQRGRLPIGEKGVGRFAVHHLGRHLRLATRARGNREILLEVDWDRFDESEVFLDGLNLTAIERTPQIFQGEATGTRIEITRPRAPWSEKVVRKVHRTLKRLQSPLREGADEFRVQLACAEFPDLQDIDPTDILEYAHYQFRAIIQNDGECDYEYLCRHPAVAPRSRAGTETLAPIGGDELVGRAPECGPFWLNLYVWDRSSNFLQASGASRRELDAHCGVSLYRDGLRVLPYGEPGDDWLLLDQDRIQAPADRIGNNQVIGLVLVDQSTNLQLRDKTNREGLIENQAFQDLRTLVRAAIRLFTTHWRRDRPAGAERQRAAAAANIETARALVSAIGETARDDVPVRLARSQPGLQPTQQDDPNSNSSEGRIVTQRQAVSELVTEIDGISAEFRDQRRQRDIMRQLAATGLAAERVVHEFGRQVAAAILHTEQLEAIAGRDHKARDVVAAVAVCLRTLRNEFRVLAPYESVGRTDRMRSTRLAGLVDLALLLNQNPLNSAQVETAVVGEDFAVRSRPAAIVQILDNLIHNATYWVATRGGGARRIVVALRPADRQVVVVDTGPGVHQEILDQLFQPFTTLKVDGTGLGLFISAELTECLGCTLRLADDGERLDGLDGAAFVLEFPHETQNEKERPE
jgi:signal transduction histidine kinase